MSSQEVTQKQSSGLANTTSSAMKTTTENVSSAAASLSGAFSGSVSAGAHASSKKTTTTSSGGQQLSKQEAGQLYQERIEDEYAKRGYLAHDKYLSLSGTFLMAPNVEKAITLIDTAHNEDPNKIEINGYQGPYELHYAKLMTKYLDMHTPDASSLLKTAVRAQHFRRWEVPRSSYPEGKAGYFKWRTYLKQRQAEQVKDICLQCDYSDDEASHVASLIAKEDLKKGEGKGDPEAQVLEDVACLVFLEDQFDAFEQNHDEEKIVNILQKTWVKMGKRGQDLALAMDLSDRGKELVGKALAS